ncbi:MAG: polysaccharide deacetylase family protein [Planctomycetota bacterium]|nr:polysaccharide deacetylase family protein [Planctomycetota bacterium]
MRLLTIDVEDWFCVLDVGGPSVEEWDTLSCRLPKLMKKTLSLLQSTNRLAVFFVLGWVAEKHPEIVRKIKEAGHEIASHGYAHKLVYEQTPDEFRNDLRKSKEAIRNACGITPIAYRAPGFSITPRTPWAFEILAEEGFTVDASIFPARRGHGGWRNFCPLPCRILTKSGSILELPSTTYTFFGCRIPFSGGGYLRLFPYLMTRHFTKILNRNGIPVIFYIHPRELDRYHPRLRMNLYRRFKSYVALASALPKLRRLLTDFNFTSLENLIKSLTFEKLPIVDLR